MRQITRDAFQSYVSYLRQHHPANWKAVDPQIKDMVIRHLLIDVQQGISAYTERKLNAGDRSLHVDHFIKQKFLSSQETLDYANFFVDEHSGDENYGADYKDNSKHTPIHTKQDNLEIINPSTDDPHLYFCYSSDGDIYTNPNLSESGKKKAEKTRLAFNLSHPSLCAERLDVIRTISYCKQGGMSCEDIKDTLLSTPYSYSYPSLIEYLCNECFDDL